MAVTEGLLDRRAWFSWVHAGLGGAALATLVTRDGVARAAEVPGEAGGLPHHRLRAKRVVHVCLCGGMSHLDTFDHKPLLTKYHGQKLPGSEKPETFFGQVGLLRRNDWGFRRHCLSGLWVSDLFPHTGPFSKWRVPASARPYRIPRPIEDRRVLTRMDSQEDPFQARAPLPSPPPSQSRSHRLPRYAKEEKEGPPGWPSRPGRRVLTLGRLRAVPPRIPGPDLPGPPGKHPPPR
jgi:hypothetical protein